MVKMNKRRGVVKKIDPKKPVLVTGGSGYLASWIVKQLLDEGMTVHATVRDVSDTAKYGHLTGLAERSSGKLKVFHADLLQEGSFDAAMEGCELVCHTASPFLLDNPKDPENDLIKPARQGTENVLGSASRQSSVKRVVLTSSIAAIFGDCADIALTSNNLFTENDWNTTSSVDHQPYCYSKTVAEKAAWSMMENQSQWDLVVINPGWILGPSLTRRTDSASIKTMIEFGNGTFKSGVPDLCFGMVDARDAALAHIRAGLTPEAEGRHIIVSQSASLMDIADILKKQYGKAYPFPRRVAPKWFFWLVAPLYGRTRKYVAGNIGFHMALDNTKSRESLNIDYRPFEQTVLDHFQQLVDDGLIS
jgi:nucleoside-diphosphate-sugar epimerase